MATVGEQLRAAREARGLTLEDVEAVTRIRVEYLEALEQEHVDALPNPVVARGFLRNYAQFLELDPEPLVQALLPADHTTLGPTSSTSGISPLNEPLRQPLIPLDSIISTLIVILIVAGLSVAAWYVIPRRQEAVAWLQERGLAGGADVPALTPLLTPSSTPQQARTVTVPPVTPSGTPKPTATPTATPVPTATRPPRTPTPEEAGPGPPANELRMTLQITAPAWLFIQVDGQEAFMGTLEAGEQREWVGRQEIFIRTGNAGGVRLFVNGEDLGLLGQVGQVLNRVIRFDPETGLPTVVEPTPTPVPTTTDKAI
ncbi:MAG: DUF4115 domain-containing protein, partial [Ardenticatenia bacterium]|nr:DUF4115 domain-containing protein [Ardenticatenia bacterium]